MDSKGYGIALPIGNIIFIKILKLILSLLRLALSKALQCANFKAPRERRTECFKREMVEEYEWNRFA